jgi:mRNA-degrading endonuclease toxin of MazEF toxin-antitoxin module
MALKAANDRLSITHTKAKATPTYTTSVEVRLTSGDVDSVSRVEWSAVSSVEWLRLGTITGTVDSRSPVAEIPVTVHDAKLNDTGASGPPLKATITVSNRIAGRSDLFDNGTQRVVMDVEVSIAATPHLTRDDASVRNAEGKDVGKNSVLAPGDMLVIVAKAFDYSRLPIPRAGLRITASLIGPKSQIQLVELQHISDNTYRGEITSAWLEDTGGYQLQLNTSSSSLEWPLTVAASNQSLYIAVGISSVWPLSTHSPFPHHFGRR